MVPPGIPVLGWRAAVSDASVEALRAEQRDGFLATMGSLRRWWLTTVLRRFRRGILPEVENDLMAVLQLATRFEPGVSAPEQKQVLAEILAHLDVATIETDVARAWRHINQADASLPLVAPRTELPACGSRLEVWDRSLDENWRKRLQAPSEAYARACQSGKDEDIRRTLNTLQLARSQVWNELNNRMALKRALWASLGRWVLLATSLAVAMAALLRLLSGTGAVGAPLSLIAAPVFGFFGGALSALVRARQEQVESPSYRTVKLNTVLRMLIGAAGGFVVYVAAVALPLGAISSMVQSDVYVFVAACIAGGFSERLFADALEQVANNLKSVG